MSRIFADTTPLRVSPDFRRIWTGMLLSSVGTQLTVVCLSLQIYQISHSSFYVGLLGIVSLVPLVISGLLGGSVADAFDRRRVVLYSSLVLWAVSIMIAAQAWLGLNKIWVLYVLVAVQSVAYGVNQPARSAIIPQLVEPKLLPAANALSSLVFNMGMTVGPLLAGVLVARIGFAWTYTIDVVSFTAALWAMLRLPALLPSGERQRAGFAAVRDGFAYLATRPNVRMTFLVDLAAMVLAQPRALIPAIAATVLGGGGTTVGILLAAPAIGSLLAGVFSGPLGAIRRQGLAVLLCVAAWGFTIFAFGVVVLSAGKPASGGSGSVLDGGGISPAVWLAAAVLALSGAADNVSSVFRNTILQTATPDSMRGRLQGVFVVVVAGGPRLGDGLAGVSGSAWGEGTATVVGGLCCVLAVVLLAWWQPRFRHYDARHPEA